jgi:hypothetical protein
MGNQEAECRLPRLGKGAHRLRQEPLWENGSAGAQATGKKPELRFEKRRKEMKKSIGIKKLTSMAVAGLFTVAAAATGAFAYPTADIAAWDTTGLLGTEAAVAGRGALHVSAINLTRGAGLTPSAAANNFGSTGWDGVDAGDYFEFGLTIESGYQASLNDLWIGSRSSSTGPGTIGFYSSLDGYANPFYTQIQPNGTYANTVIDLSALGPVNGSLFIRLYEIGNTQADGAGDTAGTGTFRIGDYYDGIEFYDIVITGETSQAASAVPLPNTVWMLGFGILSLAAARGVKQE